MNNDTMNAIKFDKELVTRLNSAMATASVAVAEAAMSAVAQDRKVTVRTFASALREVAPMLGTNNAVLSAAVKAAKEKGAVYDDVARAMALAALKKRDDDRKRAADKRAAAPQKALERAEAQVEECRKAMRTPVEVARDNYETAKMAVTQAEQALDVAVNALAEAEQALAKIMQAEAEAKQAEA